MEEKMQKMCENFYWKYRDYMFRFERKNDGLLLPSQLIEFVCEKCPKTVLKTKDALIWCCDMLWRVLHDFGILSFDEDIEDVQEDINYYQQLNLKFR